MASLRAPAAAVARPAAGSALITAEICAPQPPSNEDAIVEALGGLAENWPFMIAISIFMVAGLTTSQSAATRTMVPLGLALGIGAGYMIAMWTAVVGVLFLPANGTQIAAAEADTTGTTTLGKRVVDHSFQLPLQVGWIVTALVGIGIVALFH